MTQPSRNQLLLNNSKHINQIHALKKHRNELTDIINIQDAEINFLRNQLEIKDNAITTQSKEIRKLNRKIQISLSKNFRLKMKVLLDLDLSD